MISGSAPPSSTSWLVASIILAAHANAAGCVLDVSVCDWKAVLDVFLTCEHEVEEVARGGQHHSVCEDVFALHHQNHVTQDSLQTHTSDRAVHYRLGMHSRA